MSRRFSRKNLCTRASIMSLPYIQMTPGHWGIAPRLIWQMERSIRAIADARSAYQADDNSYNRDLFIEALTAGLTSDFGKHRQELRDLAQLVKLDSERAMFFCACWPAGCKRPANRWRRWTHT